MFSTGLCLKLLLNYSSKDDFFKWKRREKSSAVLASRMQGTL